MIMRYINSHLHLQCEFRTDIQAQADGVFEAEEETGRGKMLAKTKLKLTLNIGARLVEQVVQ